MDCTEALDLVYYSFDGLITPSQQALLEGHRRTCYACARTLVKAERLQELLRHVPQLHVPRGLEDRLIHNVMAQTGGVLTMARPEKPQFTLANLSGVLKAQNWKPALVFAGAVAAAVGVFFWSRSAVEHLAVGRPADETVNAVIAGRLQDIAPDHSAVVVAEASTPISSGETLANSSTQPATVAVSPYLAVTISGGSEVHVDRLRANPATGAVSVINVRLDRGAVRIREVLHRDTSPIHVTTGQATFVPSGTIFAVSEAPKSTHLTVQQGEVAVYLPGRTFNVLAGHGVKILATGGVLRDAPPKTKHLPKPKTT